MRTGFEEARCRSTCISKLRGSTSGRHARRPFRTHTVAVNVRDLDRFDAGDGHSETLVEKG
jgi:hypothetical protein